MTNRPSWTTRPGAVEALLQAIDEAAESCDGDELVTARLGARWIRNRAAELAAQAATQGAGGEGLGNGGGDWPEDEKYENGVYSNTCCRCDRAFIGHKRRVVCKACATKSAAATSPTLGQDARCPQCDAGAHTEVEHLRAVVAGQDALLAADDVEWVVNDIAELGVKIRGQFFFCYKGYSLVYEEAVHDDGRPMHWRPVFKREFGECVHPVNWKEVREFGYQKTIGTVSLQDSDEWKPLPAAASTPPVEGETTT